MTAINAPWWKDTARHHLQSAGQCPMDTQDALLQRPLQCIPPSIAENKLNLIRTRVYFSFTHTHTPPRVAAPFFSVPICVRMAICFAPSERPQLYLPPEKVARNVRCKEAKWVQMQVMRSLVVTLVHSNVARATTSRVSPREREFR